MKYKSQKTNLTKYTSCKTDAEKRKILKLKRIKKLFILVTIAFSLTVTLKNTGILNTETIKKLSSSPSGESDIFLSLNKFFTKKLSFSNTIGKYGSEFCFDYLNPSKSTTVNAHAKSEPALSKNKINKPIISRDETNEKNENSDISESSCINTSFSAVSPCSGTITSPFGERIHPLTKEVSFHNGIDIGAFEGEPIYCISDGIIKTADYNEFSGNYIIITHKDGYTSSYAHMSSLTAEAGMAVNKGSLIGYVGSTGNVTGPHLHIEIRKDGSPVDPQDFFEQE